MEKTGEALEGPPPQPQLTEVISDQPPEGEGEELEEGSIPPTQPMFTQSHGNWDTPERCPVGNRPTMRSAFQLWTENQIPATRNESSGQEARGVTAPSNRPPLIEIYDMVDSSDKSESEESQPSDDTRPTEALPTDEEGSFEEAPDSSNGTHSSKENQSPPPEEGYSSPDDEPEGQALSDSDPWEGNPRLDPWEDKELMDTLRGDPVERLPPRARHRVRRRAKNYTILVGEEHPLRVWLANRGWRTVPSPKDRRPLIWTMHQERSHIKAPLLTKVMRSLYWWPDLGLQVQAVLGRCKVCQQGSIHRPPPRRLQQQIVLEVWERLGIDLLSMPQGRHNEHYIAVAQDYMSKFTVVKALTSKKAKAIRAWLEEVFLKLGPPKELIFDRGREFNNEEVKSLLERWGVRGYTTRGYHPQTNGLVERTNQTLLNWICPLVMDDPSTWPKVLDRVVHELNSRTVRGIRLSPSAALFGRDWTHRRSELEHDHVRASRARWKHSDIQLERARLDTPSVLKEREELLRERLQTTRLQQQEGHRRKRQRPFTERRPFQIGDQVWIREPNPQARAHKWDPRWTGPARILEASGDYYELDISEGRTRILHSDHLVLRRPASRVCQAP